MKGKARGDLDVPAGLVDLPPDRKLAALRRVLAVAKEHPELIGDREYVSFLWYASDQLSDMDNPPPLDHLFGNVKRGRGGTSPEYADLLARRDAIIVDAWRRVPEWREHSAYTAAGHISRAARIYLNGRWKIDRKAVTPPADVTSAALWSILKVDHDLPERDGLYKILKAASA